MRYIIVFTFPLTQRIKYWTGARAPRRHLWHSDVSLAYKYPTEAHALRAVKRNIHNDVVLKHTTIEEVA